MWFDRLLQGALDTLLMVGVSSLIALPVGVVMAVVLVTSDRGGIYQAPALNRVLGAFVNLFRSVPFLILMVALIPFTRLIVGTTYGVWAAVVPLTIAATPFFARIAEVSLREVDHGLIEAAQAMGCRRWHIVWHVLLPEARPGIVAGFTITVVTMINSSAMAGATKLAQRGQRGQTRMAGRGRCRDGGQGAGRHRYGEDHQDASRSARRCGAA